jgi:CHAT domain
LSGKRDKGAPRGASLVTRDGLAAPDAVRSLPSLPDTRTEVEEVAWSVGAGSGDLYFAERATERAVKSAVLQDLQIVYFAIMRCSLTKTALRSQPLFSSRRKLRPPRTTGCSLPTRSARCTSTWTGVVLSACNTAGPVGRGLSGLARAFLFAGAKALLVSNCYWRATRLPGRWHPHSTSSPATRQWPRGGPAASDDQGAGSSAHYRAHASAILGILRGGPRWRTIARPAKMGRIECEVSGLPFGEHSRHLG